MKSRSQDRYDGVELDVEATTHIENKFVVAHSLFCDSEIISDQTNFYDEFADGEVAFLDYMELNTKM